MLEFYIVEVFKMLKFDYREAAKNDIFEYLKENYRNNKIFDYIYREDGIFFVGFDEDFVRKITRESTEFVTGKYSVNYACSKEKAKECVLDDGIDILDELVFDGTLDKETIGDYFLNEDWQAMDAECRCYCCIDVAVEAVSEFEEYLNEQNTLLEKIYIECGGCDNE